MEGGSLAPRSSEAQTSKRPVVSEAQAAELTRQFFGLEAKIVKELESYGDRNFYVKGKRSDGSTAEQEFVLKILNHVDSDEQFIDAQNSLTLFLKKKGFECPTPVRGLNGEYKVMWPNAASNSKSQESVVEVVRLLTFVPGHLLADVPITARLLYDLGRTVAKFNQAIQANFDPAIETRIYDWDLQNLENIHRYIVRPEGKGDEDSTAELLNYVYERFTREVLPRLAALDKQIIHNDFNEKNVLVSQCDAAGEASGYVISGILDFGDICFSYRPFDVSICVAHMIMAMCISGESCSRATSAAGHVITGYQATFPLSPMELDVVYWSVAARICQCVAMGQRQSLLDPRNAYLKSYLRIGAKVLQHYVGVPKNDMMKEWLSQSLDGKA